MQAAAQTREEVIERRERAEPKIRSLAVRRIARFGSFASAKQHAESEGDLLVEFLSGGKTFARSWT